MDAPKCPLCEQKHWKRDPCKFKSLDKVVEVADSKDAKVVVTEVECAGCKAKDEIIEELNAKLEVRRKNQRELMRKRRKEGK